MKKPVYLSFLFCALCAPCILPRAAAADDLADFIKNFSPNAKKAAACRNIQKIKTALSCRKEKQEAPEAEPSKQCAAAGDSSKTLQKHRTRDGALKIILAKALSNRSALLEIFAQASAYACSFECSAGKEMCDETINPDKDPSFFPYFTGSYQAPGHEYYKESSAESSVACLDQIRSRRDMTEPEITVEEIAREADEDGHKYLIRLTKYDNDLVSCIESRTYLIVHDEATGERIELEEHSQEWSEYMQNFELEKARQEYRDTCFVPAKEDCDSIEAEKTQCMLDLAEAADQEMCQNPINPLWIYRIYKEEKAAEEEERIKYETDSGLRIIHKESAANEKGAAEGEAGGLSAAP